ncbi:MAG TPA: AsmA-like C-terminal region-containing protein [Pirellulales bacterium]|nr:AsmA-like C-terminal region-containing protein [Pirellulales bacterium]
MIRFCWRSCKWIALLLVLAAAVAVPWFYHRFDDEVRRRVEARLAEQYPQLRVSVRSARLTVGQGVEIRGLSIVEPDVAGPTAELAYIEEVLLQGKTELAELLRGDLSIENIVIRRPTVRVTQRPDGTWSAARLLPLPKLSKNAPRGTIENGVIEIVDPTKQQGGSFALRDAQLKFEPAGKENDKATGRQGDKANRQTGRAPIRLQGHWTADHVQRIDVDATIDPSGKSWSIRGAVIGLDFSPELVSALPSAASRRLGELGSLRCAIKGRFLLTQGLPGKPDFAYELSGQLQRGRIDDPRLPYPLIDLQAGFRVSPAGLLLSEATARNGQTTLRLDFERKGFARSSPYTLVAESRHMQFDQQLRSILPLAWQNEWNKFMPGGEFDAQLRLDYDGRRWQPQLVISCRNVSFSYYNFPYRLERGQGRLELKDNLLDIELKAFSEGEEVRIVGQYHSPGAGARGFIKIRGDNLRLDEKLFLALKEKPRRIVRSLNPRGTFNFFVHLWHGNEPKPVVHTHLELAFNRCSLRYDEFPYPLDNIRGAMVMDDHVWQFNELTGTNDTGQVTCNGSLTPTPDGNDLRLSFVGEAVALEDELRDALGIQNPAAARFWRDLRPRGVVNLEAHIHHPPGRRKPDVTVTARPLYEPESGLSASIEPSYFRYRLEKLRGQFHYEQGRMTLENVRAEHRGVKLNAAGVCTLDGEGGWRLRFERLEVDRLRADADLLQALGGRLKKVITDLRPKGPFNLSGTLELASGGQPAGGLQANWSKFNVQCQGGAIDCGVVLENIFGGVVLSGSFDGQRFSCAGELAVDSMTYRDFQLTECLGPLWIDDGTVLLGRAADARRSATRPRRVTAKLYGGALLAEGRVTLAEQPRYSFYASLSGADLARFAQEAVAGRQKLTGQVAAEVDLHGAGRGLHNLEGRGVVRLRNAELYELPVMVALLKPLSGRLPDTTAFNTADVGFHLQGEHIYLNRIECNGDAVSLRGRGQMGLDRSIQLSFYALVGRGDGQLPLLDKLLSAASQQIMQIRVGGTLDNPVSHNELLPNIEEARRWFQDDLAGGQTRRPGMAARRPLRRAAAPPASYGSNGPR